MALGKRSVFIIITLEMIRTEVSGIKLQVLKTNKGIVFVDWVGDRGLVVTGFPGGEELTLVSDTLV